MEVIKLNLIPGKACPVVHASQFDDGRDFKAELYEGVNVYTLDGTETLTAIVKKPDGNEVTVAVTNTSDNYVIITTTEQMTACAGGNLGTLRIEKGAVTIATLNFILECQASPDTGIQSDSEIHNLEAQVNQMVEDAVAEQYDSNNVLFDTAPTSGHGVPYAVTSGGLWAWMRDLPLRAYPTASGAIATFDTSLALPLQDCTIEINAVQESGTPTPSSPKAISGFTGANVKVAGKNLINITDCLNDYYVKSSDLSVSSIAGANVFYCDVPKNTDLVLTPDKSNRCVILGYKTRPSTIAGSVGDELIVDSPVGITSRSFNTGDNQFLAIYVNRDSANKPTQIMLEVGTTATAHESYNSTTTAITWQSEAGTVYGGSLDVTSGVLTVTHGFKTYTGASDENWSFEMAAGGTQKNFYIAVSDAKRPQTSQNSTMKCNLSPISNTSSAVQDTCFISNGRNFNFTWGNTLNISSTTDFKTWLGSNNIQVCYELETPVTYQLTPTQISAIVGTNNVFTDTNGNTSVVYACSLKDYIDGQ